MAITPPDIRRRLFSSFNAQSIAILLRVAQQTIMVPALITGWGTGVAQDWILISAGAGLFAMCDFGAQVHFANSLVIDWARGDRAAYCRTFSIAMTCYGAIVLLVMSGLLGLSLLAPIDTMLGTKLLSENGVQWAFDLMALSTICLLPIGVVGAIYRAHGDYSHGVVLVIAAEAARGFGVCLVAYLKAGPEIAAGLNLMIALLLWAVMLFDLRRRFGPIPFVPIRPRRSELLRAIWQSGLYFIPSAATPLVLTIPVLMLGRLSAAENAVLSYTVYRTLTGFVRQFVNQMCHPIGAEMSRQQAMGDLTRLRKLFLAGGRLAAGVAGLFGGVTLVLASPFLRIWTHGAVPDNLPLLTAFLVTAILLAPAQMAMVLFLYNNRPLALVLGNGGYAAGTALLCALLVKGYSAAGAAAGTGIAEFLFIGVLVTVIAARDVAVSAVRYIVLSTATAVAGFGVSLGIARALQGLMDEQTLAGLFLVGSLWAAAVALPAYFIVLHAEERRWVRTQASGVGRRVLLASGIRF